MSKKVTGIVAYITIIGWLIAFLVGDREKAKFHLNQALVLDLCSLVVSVLASVLGGVKILSLIFWIADVAIFAFCVWGIILAATDQDKPLPLIGGIQLLK